LGFACQSAHRNFDRHGGCSFVIIEFFTSWYLFSIESESNLQKGKKLCRFEPNFVTFRFL
jgi:hypothetical protein